jgi:hypothetical protein
MKAQNSYLQSLLIILALSGCKGGNTAKQAGAGDDTTSVPDTGYTGIKTIYERRRMVREVTFKNGVRVRMTKTFYPGGQLYRHSGMKKVSDRIPEGIFMFEGQLFRTTPYKMTQLWHTETVLQDRKLKAMIGYSKECGTPYLQEFTQNGKLLKDYPEIIVNVNDEYNTRGLYKVTLELSDKNTRVRFNRGELMNERFDTTFIRPVNTVNGKAVINLKKTGKAGKNYLGIIGEITTPFGNRHIVYKKVDLPYNVLISPHMIILFSEVY